ncbi:hypothetical protein ANO11243_054700 [Dothideomycetidae sp. 11243]|nr:hypothetical protein ANO11243_054700 [fungal sp. No.11243]
MMVLRYPEKGSVDREVATEVKNIRGKSVLLTSGANGPSPHLRLVQIELNEDGVKCAFVECNITGWDQQKLLFDTAKSRSPSNSVDVVIANAGIGRCLGDSLWNSMVNVIGTLYTFKLAVHYFRKQPQSEDHDHYKVRIFKH